MKKQCVRCWLHIDSWLWCKRCRARVDEELRGEISRPYEYYFRFNLKRMRHENKMQMMWERDREERE